MRISDWSSDVCSSDLPPVCVLHLLGIAVDRLLLDSQDLPVGQFVVERDVDDRPGVRLETHRQFVVAPVAHIGDAGLGEQARRSEEHTSELQSLMRISYAVFCLKKKK